jgi:hypothetical protein
MDRVNQACSEAEEIRALFSWNQIPLEIPLSRSHGIEIYHVPIRLFRWWLRFGSLKFEDEDLIRARKDMTRYSWFTALSLVFILGAAAVEFLRKK